MAVPTPPFAVSDAELSEVEGFCKRSGLDQIGRICAELRALRADYITLSKRIGMMHNRQPDPHRQFAAEIDVITSGVPNAPSVP